MLYRWPGHSGALPSVLMAHYDVVSATPEGWTHPPFEAAVIGDELTGTVWGRGSIDDKASLVGILEAVETMIGAGFVPANDIYLAFSHNEEVLGDGCRTIVTWFRQHGITPALVLDEGGIVGEPIFPGASQPHVLIGVGEKGTLTFEMAVRGQGGHASVPPPVPATARLARAMSRIGEVQFAPELNVPTQALVRLLGPRSTGAMEEAAAVLDADPTKAAQLFASISDEARAMTRTTPVLTLLRGSHAVNALPELATATVNARVMVGSTPDEVRDTLVAAIDDPQVEIRRIESFDPPLASPASGWAWDAICSTVVDVYGVKLIAPYINNGGTDSRNYAALTPFVYRFNPYEMTLVERRAIHAIDERLPLRSFYTGCQFYLRLIAKL